MSTIDWPAGFERTPPAERERDSPFSVSLAETSDDLRTELERLGVDDWRASTASGGAYTKRDGLPKHNANPATRDSSSSGPTTARTSRSPATPTPTSGTTPGPSTSG